MGPGLYKLTVRKAPEKCHQLSTISPSGARFFQRWKVLVAFRAGLFINMKSPAFQFYPADYLSDMKVRMLSWASRGLYMDLLCFCWREGFIPSDSSAIAQLCGCHDLAIVEPCLELFESHPNDEKKLVHKRLEIERNNQIERSNERSRSGKKGLESRWGKGKRANSSAKVLPIAKHSSSSSTASSFSSTNVELPFQGEAFASVWDSWVEHRKEIKKKLTETSVKQQLKQLSRWGERRSIAAIEYTIGKGWQGIMDDPVFASRLQKPQTGYAENLELP